MTRYEEWKYLRTHGQWRDGVPDWARDYNGNMNDMSAAIAVIDELSSALATEGGVKQKLSEERIDWLANAHCPSGTAYPNQVKNAIREALAEAASRSVSVSAEAKANAVAALQDAQLCIAAGRASCNEDERIQWDHYQKAIDGLTATPAQSIADTAGAKPVVDEKPSLWEAFEMGFQLRSAMLGHVLDGRDVGRLTTCEFWHPAMLNMHVGTDLHVGLTVGEAIVKLKGEVRRRLQAFDAAPAAPAIDAAPEKSRDAEIIQLIDERDTFEQMGTVLAERVSQLLDVEVGEWSSANNPIFRAIHAVEDGIDAAGASEGDVRDAKRWRYAYQHLIIGTQDARSGFEEISLEYIDAAIAKDQDASSEKEE